MAHVDYSVIGGKLVYLQEENPIVGGEKNPNLPCSSIAAALRAYSYVLLLGYFKLLRNYYFLL